MISSSLKMDYKLYNNKPIFLKNITQFSMDPLFKLYRNKEEYSKFLDELANKSKVNIKKFYQMFKPFILENIILISKTNQPLYYAYTDNFVVVYLNTQTGYQEQLKQIIGGIFVFRVIHDFKDKNLIKFITPISNIVTNLILKCTTRPLDFNEMYPEVGRIISAWYLKQYGFLSLKNLNIVLSNNNINFVSASDTRELFDKINNINLVSQLLELIAEKMNTTSSNIIISFTNKFSLDMLLGLENLYQALYMSVIARTLLFPNMLFYALKQMRDRRIDEMVKLVHSGLKKYMSKKS